jgi:hypothetical protein
LIVSLWPHVFDGVSFGAVFEKTKEEEEIECRQKEHVAPGDCLLGVCTQGTIALKSPLAKACEQQ